VIYFYYQNRKLQSDDSADNYFETKPKKTLVFDSESEELIAERDQAIRTKNETEAENLALNNRLKNKHQEVTRKEQQIETLKQEASQKELALNGKLKEKNGLITILQREINQLKEKYSKQGQLLDEEQLEAKKLEESLEKTEQEKEQLKREQTEQLRAINMLFDPQAENYSSIDFNGLYALLEKIAQKSLPGSFPGGEDD
jgi:chromosome segregation ATPase